MPNLYNRIRRRLGMSWEEPFLRMTLYDWARKKMGLKCRWCNDTGYVRYHFPPYINNCAGPCVCGAKGPIPSWARFKPTKFDLISRPEEDGTLKFTTDVDF